MLVHPIADGDHRHLRPRDLAAFDEQPPDRNVGQSILSVIADPDSAPVLQPDPARALNLQKKCVDRIVDPQQLKTASGERAILDRGPRIARTRAELGRPPINRRLIASVSLPRAV